MWHNKTIQIYPWLFAMQPTSPPGQESLPLAVAVAVAVLPLPQSQPQISGSQALINWWTDESRSFSDSPTVQKSHDISKFHPKVLTSSAMHLPRPGSSNLIPAWIIARPRKAGRKLLIITRCLRATRLPLGRIRRHITTKIKTQPTLPEQPLPHMPLAHPIEMGVVKSSMSLSDGHSPSNPRWEWMWKFASGPCHELSIQLLISNEKS